MSEFDYLTETQEVDAAELESVRKLAQLLHNTLKSLLIYPTNNPLPKEFKRKLFTGLSYFLDEHDELKMELDNSKLLYEGKVVFEEREKEEGLVHLLHQDGVRELVFVKGLEASEIDDFLQVMEEYTKSTDLEDDLVTMLWEKDLNGIKYLVVDDLLDVDVPSAEEIPDNWDFDKLFRSEVAPFDSEGGALGGNLRHHTGHHQQGHTRELLRQLKEFSPDEVGKIQQLLDMDNRHRALDEFLDVQTEILIAEDDSSEFDHLMGALTRILDSLVNVGDFHSAVNVIRRLKSFAKTLTGPQNQTDSSDQKKAEIIERVVNLAGEEDKIARITQIVNEKAMIDLAFVKIYLLALNINAVTPIIHMLRDLKEFPTRTMVCEVLADKVKSNVELLRDGISDKRWYVVRNLVSVIGSVGSEEGIRLLKQIAKHRDLRVRKEILKSLFKISGSQSGELLISFLQDEDKRIRIMASRSLAERKEQKAIPVLMEILKDSGFKENSPEEKKSMLESFAVIAQDEALPYLVKTVNRRSWLKRDKHNETRIFAIGALGMINTPDADQSLRQLRKKRNKIVRQACENALRRIESRQIREREKARIT
jgi:HEAT repeat protein